LFLVMPITEEECSAYGARVFSAELSLCGLRPHAQEAPSSHGHVTVTLNPNSAFTDNVALSCGSLPATLSCSFHPQTVYLTAGIPQAVTLTIAANAQANFASPGITHGFSAISSGMPLGAILILPPLTKKERRFLAVFALALLSLLLSSCRYVLTPNGQPASYSITVTASSSSVQPTHSAKVQVTVE
jgi:hypothetical protein